MKLVPLGLLPLLLLLPLLPPSPCAARKHSAGGALRAHRYGDDDDSSSSSSGGGGCDDHDYGDSAELNAWSWLCSAQACHWVPSAQFAPLRQA